MANQESMTMDAGARADFQRDLNDARALLELSGTNEERKKYRKAAELILLKALKVEPENTEAKALLQAARAAPAPLQTPPSAPAPKQQQAPPPAPKQQQQALKQQALK